MPKWELGVTIFCYAYVLVYGVYFIAVVSAQEFFASPIMIPLHLVGMALSFLMVILVVRDVYKRSFPDSNAKATWTLLVVFLNVFVIPVYLWKYGFRPR